MASSGIDMELNGDVVLNQACIIWDEIGGRNALVVGRKDKEGRRGVFVHISIRRTLFKKLQMGLDIIVPGFVFSYEVLFGVELCIAAKGESGM